MDPNLVILAGGVSSRMKKPAPQPETVDPALLEDAKSKSKSMIRVGDHWRPFLDYLLYNAREAGYHDVVIVIGRLDRKVREYYGQADAGNEFHGLTISYAVQEIPEGRAKPLGTADAVIRALRVKPAWRGASFTVCNSDNLYSKKALRLLLENTAEGAMIDYDRTALEFNHERIQQFAIIKKDARGFLEDIIEKPTQEQVERAKDHHGRVGVSMNIFRLPYDRIVPFLEEVPLHPVRNEKELPVAVKMMVHRYPRSVATIPLAEHVPDLTNQTDIADVKEYLKKEFPNFSLEQR